MSDAYKSALSLYGIRKEVAGKQADAEAKIAALQKQTAALR